MAKYKLILDESGTFSKNGEKYIIIGGLYFDVKYEKELDAYFRPLHKRLCEVFNVKELHGSDNKKILKYLCAPIGMCDKIQPIVFVIDKEKSFIFDSYTKDAKSFKYNKAIEHLIKKMIKYKHISENDEIYIRIDNLNLTKEGKRNLSNYLPKNIKCVKSVEEGDSKDYICLQFADIIVNHFSKNKYMSTKDVQSRLLNPLVFCFLNESYSDYIDKHNTKCN